ncbi:unnamed protein product, partial [Mycena citricolor]
MLTGFAGTKNDMPLEVSLWSAQQPRPAPLDRCQPDPALSPTFIPHPKHHAHMHQVNRRLVHSHRHPFPLCKYPPQIHEIVTDRRCRMLSCIEWLSVTVTGRAISLLSTDFDQELLIECDDEYWAASGPDQFKQPENEPLRITYFAHLIKLMDIQASITRTIYAARAPKKLYGLPLPSSDAKALATFDPYLNGWMSTVPVH